MTNADVLKYDYESKKVRIVMQDNEPWFIAKDVCDILQLKNSQNMRKYMDADEISTVSIGNSANSTRCNIISEPGLYKVIMRSRSAMAKPFQRWVTHDVLPAIRKTGVYSGFAAAGLLPAANQRLIDLTRRMNARIRWDLRLLMERHRLTSADLVRFAQETAAIPGTIAGFDWHRWDTAEPAPSDLDRLMRTASLPDYWQALEAMDK